MKEPTPDICHSCGAPLRSQARFCSRCGQPRDTATPSACRRCGNLLPPTARFCTACGACVADTARAHNTTIHRAAYADAIPAPELPTPEELPDALFLPPTTNNEQPLIALKFSAARFGLTVVHDPQTGKKIRSRLTFSDEGITNNTRVAIDGATPIFGEGGTMETHQRRDDNGLLAVWRYGGVRVTQRVMIAPGPASRRLDTARIVYELESADGCSHQVGLRLMIDTLIGDNDGVPFLVPGRDGISERALELRGDDIPDFVQAIERADLRDPGAIARLTFRGSGATRPERLVLCGWPGSQAQWEFFERMGAAGAPLRNRIFFGFGAPDSAVGIYYPTLPLEPGQTRRIVALYGLGSLSSTTSQNAVLSLTCARDVPARRPFWIAAMVIGPREGQSVVLHPLPGLRLLADRPARQTLRPEGTAPYTQVSWLAEADEPLGDIELIATLEPEDITERRSVTIHPPGAVD